MRPPPNLATDTTPAAFAFYYMTYKYALIVRKRRMNLQ